MNIFKLIRFMKKKDRKILPPKPMPFSQKGNMKIDLVLTKNKK